MTNLICFDLETTGVDVFNDRIVTAAITEMTPKGEEVKSREWLVDPGIVIPEEASDIHGVTTERAREYGQEAKSAVSEIVGELISLEFGTPIVIMNANFDLSLLYYEAERYGIRFEPLLFKVIDPLVLDRHLDKYRKGRRNLVSLAKHYGVDVDEDMAHDAAYDNLLAGRVTIQIVDRYNVTNKVLEEQASMYREWAVGFEQYLRRNDPTATVDKEWPLRVKEGM